MVFAPGGLGQSAVAERIPVALCGLGQGAQLGGSSARPGLWGRSGVFASQTPFVLPRHRKRGDEPEDQLVRELTLHGLPTPLRIERTQSPPGLATPLPWSAFVLHRSGDELTMGYFGFRLQFAEPVPGPLLLGYGCHYALGQFVPYAE